MKARTTRNYTIWIGVMALSLFILSLGCDQQSSNSARTSTKSTSSVQAVQAVTPTVQPTPTSTTVEEGPLTRRKVMDSVGREISVPTTVNRVISLNSDLTEIIFALGATDKLVAAGYRISQGPGEAWIAGIAPHLVELPSPHTPAGVNAEEVLSLGPDLIVSTEFGEVGYEEVIDSLERLDIPIVIISFEGMDTYWEDLTLLGQLLGVEDRTKEIIALMRDRLEKIQARTKSLPADRQPVRVYHGLWNVYVATNGGIFEDDQIKAAGGINVSAALTDFGTQVTAEQLISWNPEVIISLYEAPAVDITSDPNLQDIDAVKNGRVFSHPEQGWGFATPRAFFAVEWMAKKLYPDIFVDFDLEAEADRFYRAIYGIDYDGPPLD